MIPSQCAPDDPSGDLDDELALIAGHPVGACRCHNCTLSRGMMVAVGVMIGRSMLEQDSPTVADLGGGAGEAGAGAEPPAHLLEAEREARRTEDGPSGPDAWPEGEDFRLACRQAVLARRSERTGGPAWRAQAALDRACAILDGLEAKPVPPADLKYRPAGGGAT